MASRFRRFLWVAAGLAAVGALAAAGAAGFYAGRKVPRGLFARLSSNAARLPTWDRHPDAPLARFEMAAVEIEGRILVFGGFHNAAIQASSEVWAYDTATRAWTRRGDLPAPLTHVMPARLRDRLWFAGGFLGDNPGTVTDQVWSYDWRNDRWSPGPPLPARVGSGALLALDSRLHFFGGYVENFNADSDLHWSLDLADSSAGGPAWVPRARLPRPRGHLGGAALAGRLYALGGNISHDPDPLDVDWVDRYDPATDRWTEAAPFPFPRSHFESSIVVRDGRLIVAGGRARPIGQESVDAVTEYDPQADRWLALPPLPEPRFAPLVVLAGGRMLAGLGGRESSNPDNRTLWVERTESAWQPVGQLPAVLAEVGGAVIWPRLYLLGGVEPWTLALDLRTGHWDAPPTHPVRPVQGDHHAVEVWNGRLYVFGGLQPERGMVQIFDPASNLWRRGPAMPYGAGSVVTARIGDRIYVAGGIVDDTTTRLSAVFDPASETWGPMAPMPRGRNHTAAATDGQRLFVFGGRGPGSGDGNHLANGYADVQVYDPASDRWTASGEGPDAPLPLPQARGGMGKAVYAAGEFWVFGGETLDGPGANRRDVYERVDVYDPVRNRWRSGPPLPTGRHGIFPLLVGDRVYVLGGGSRAGHSATLVAEVLDLRRAAKLP